MNKITIAVLAVIILAGGAYLFLKQAKKHVMVPATVQTQNTVPVIPTVTPIPTKSQNNALANPASVNCTKFGGTLTIEKNAAGAEYGLCNFAV